MKATLTFDLYDPDDKMAHIRAIKSIDMASVLWELQHNTYKKLENLIERQPDMKPEDVLHEFYNEFYSVMQANGIDIDNLYN